MTSWKNPAWQSAFKMIGKSDPILQMKSLEIKKSMKLRQGHLTGGELSSEVPRWSYFSIEKQHPPNVPKS